MRTEKRETIQEDRLGNLVKVLLCVFLALLSFCVFGKIFSKPETFAELFQSIDAKVSATLKLTTSATAASAAISAIPDDIGTPIAEKLADFSEYGFVVLCILYAEKFLMTILGEAAFKYIVPIGCFLYITAMLVRSKRMEQFIFKVVLVSVALFLMIPLGVKVSDKIYDTYHASIDSTLSQAEQLTEDTSLLGEANGDQNKIQAVFQYLGQSAGELADRASRILNRFIESIAVIIVTSCLIPLAVIIFSLWIIKQLLGVSVPVPALKPSSRRRARGKRDWPARIEQDKKDEIEVGVG